MIQFLNFFGAACTPAKGSFFGFPAWNKYLGGVTDGAGNCIPHFNHINDVWLIAAAILELMLRFASIAAVVFIVWAGIDFITSEGEPDKTAKAQNTMLNAAIGLVISIAAATVVSFLAGRFGR